MSEPKTTSSTEAVPETVPLVSSGSEQPEPIQVADEAAQAEAEAAARQALPIPGMPLYAPVPVVDEED